jgi:hypothetical protein
VDASDTAGERHPVAAGAADGPAGSARPDRTPRGLREAGRRRATRARHEPPADGRLIVDHPSDGHRSPSDSHRTGNHRADNHRAAATSPAADRLE